MAHKETLAHGEKTSHALAVGDRGRVVIPAGLRQTLGIGPGATLLAHVDDAGRLVLEPRQAAVARLRGMIEADDGRSLVDELLTQRRAEAALEDAKASGDMSVIRRARDNLRHAGER